MKKTTVAVAFAFLFCLSANAQVKNLVGSWKADFDGKKPITIVIQSASTGYIGGYSVLGKNKQTFEGVVLSEKRNAVRVELHEPGSKKGDGTFTLYFDVKSKSVFGNWAMYSNPGKSYTITGYKN